MNGVRGEFQAVRAGAALLFLSFGTAHAASSTTIETDPGSKIEIELSQDFEVLPASSAVPLHITVHNNTNRNGTWRFTANSGGGYFGISGIEAALNVSVGPGETRTTAFVVPSLPNVGYKLVRVVGTGVKGSVGHFLNRSSFGSGPASQFLAMSRDLSSRSWETLRKKVIARNAFCGTQFDVADLAPDWRGFAGVEWMAMSAFEWKQLAPDVRSAIRQWVGQGGRLMVAVRDTTEIDWSGFHLASEAGPLGYGFGDVRAAIWDGKEVSADVLAGPIVSGAALSARLAAETNSAQWPMLAALGQLKPDVPLILSFVIAFAALVGPVNLFVFAPAARRHRMFWTTPLISLGGSFALMGVIFLQEGIGGKGGRFTLVRLFPEDHEELVLQDQVSRTALLPWSGFELKDDGLVLPIRLGGVQEHRNTVVVEGRSYSGDWFRNRSIQAQQLATVRCTRAALTLLGRDASGAPRVVSSFENTLEKLIIVFEDGGLWRGENVRTGEIATLHPVDRSTSARLWKEAVAPARQPSMRQGLESLTRSPDVNGRPPAGRFFATFSNAKGEAMETLRSIRWAEDRVVVLGPVTRASATSEGGSSQ